MKTILNRRRILAGLAASATAIAASPSGGQTAPKESPELLRMSDALPVKLKAYHDAAERVRAIVREWGPQWPEPHPDIMEASVFGANHRDILGFGISTEKGASLGQEEGIAKILSVKECQTRAESHLATATRMSGFKRPPTKRIKVHLDWAKRDKARILHARKYWAEIRRIKSASGIERCTHERREAEEALRVAVGEILTFEERSPMGLAIKAQAIIAWGQVRQFSQKLNLEAPEWMAGIAETITRQAA
ncbi:MAG: hypothetical protein AAF340_02855 [Pseudomonadota bacterium]